MPLPAMATALSTTTRSEAETDDSNTSQTSTIYHTATESDLSILRTRDAYIDANLTSILHTTPKTATYLDTTPNTLRGMTDAQIIAKQQQRIEALTKENSAWIEQYQHASQQNQSLHAYVDQLQHQFSALKAGDSAAVSSSVQPPNNSLYRALLSENAALLSRVDSLQRRCRVQEGMIDTRNAAVREMQRICTQQQQQMRQAIRRTQPPQQQHSGAAAASDKAQQEEEKRREDDVDVASTAASVNQSIQHSRHSSTASTLSERSVELEQAEALLDAVLMRPPRIFVPTSTTPSVASTQPSSPKEERKQLDTSSHSSPPRVAPSKPTTLARRIGKPPLTVQSTRLQRPVVSTLSTRISPRSPASPSPLSGSSTSGVVSRARSSSATAAGAVGVSKVGSRAGSGLGKSPTLSPSLSPVPSSPRSPLTLPSAASRPAARVPSSPVPRSPITARESSTSKTAVGSSSNKVLRPSSASSASSTASANPPASPTRSAHTSTATATTRPVTRARPASASSTTTPHSAQPVAAAKTISATKASAQSTSGRTASKS